MAIIEKRPNLFVVGAPKSGTTAMVEYLKQHPQVYFPLRKELNYFGSDCHYTKLAVRDSNDAEYLRHFKSWHAEKWAGEGTVWYLYSKTAAQEIKNFSPEARILIMLRNPVEVMYSNYYQLLFNGNEDLPTFEEALAAEKMRKQGHCLPKTVMLVEALFYRDSVRYTEQVERYFRVFGQQNVHVIIFDSFKQDTSTTYKQLLKFLDLDDAFEPAFEVINPNKRVRNTMLRNMLKNPIFVSLTHRFPTVAHYAIRFHRWLNTEYVKRPPMTKDLHQTLLEEYRPEIERLSKLLDKDLSHWYKQS